MIPWSLLEKFNNAPIGVLITLIFYIYCFPIKQNQPNDSINELVPFNRKLLNHEPCLQSAVQESSTTTGGLPEIVPEPDNVLLRGDQNVELLKLAINDESYEMGLRRNGQVYFPWTWIEPYFDVYGNINAENDTFKFSNGN